LLDGDHPTLSVLRQQVDYVTVNEREWHGAAGFVTSLLVDLAAPSAGLEFSEDISDVVATIGGMSGPAVFVVFIGAGRLTALEGTGFDDEDWPDPITDFELSYVNEPRHMPPWEPPPVPHVPWWRQLINIARFDARKLGHGP
jgi:hypothetical protein